MIDGSSSERLRGLRTAPRLSRKTKWVVRFGYILGIAGLIYLLRAPLLVGIAETWVVRQNIEKADAIMLLGGGLQTRTFEAARLYQQGFAPRVLIVDVKREPTDDLEVTVPQRDLMKRVLLKEAVPEEAIIIVGNNVSSTFEEAVALRVWAQASGAHKVIVPTELFHTRRVYWVFHKVLKGTGTEIRVRALNPLEYTKLNWWQCEQGLVDFQREATKFAYYLMRY